MPRPSDPLTRPPLATVLLLPLLVAAVSTATWGLLGTSLPKPAASSIPVVFALASVLLLERVFPLHRVWNRGVDRSDIALLLLNRGVDAGLLLGSTLLVAELADVAPALVSAWPRALPVPVQVAVGITLAEGIRYALHRLSHRPGLLGYVHETHHAPTRMYALNGPRLHPGNYLWVAAAHTAPMLLLGADIDVVITTINVTAVFVIVQHANIRLRFDGLSEIFATPDVHRWHHRREGGERAVNYAVVLVVFDRLFGTYRRPGADPAAEDIGPPLTSESGAEARTGHAASSCR